MGRKDRVPGLELRIERIRHGLRQADVAEALGVSARRVSTLETLATVAPATAERYRQAISQLDPGDAAA